MWLGHAAFLKSFRPKEATAWLHGYEIVSCAYTVKELWMVYARQRWIKTITPVWLCFA